ncbi:MAG: 2-polyprenylphenol 6-hydroxylase [Zetaproteobacteria bacterium]|nr:2-polyprenylphenol 6-hydroxylase [Zetaproteobacteria bacterium]
MIAHVLVRHGLAALAVRLYIFRPYSWLFRLFKGRELPRDLGVQLRLVLEALGPTFIKFGQMLSTRVDLLPMDIAMALKQLQDDVAPDPIASVLQQLEQSYGRPVIGENGVFSSFDEQPVAAASIAQVYFATLADGTEVAVKVKRASIEKVIAGDLALLALLASLFERYFPEYKRLKAKCVVHEFSQSIRGELNLRTEAARASRFNDNLKKVDGVRVPNVRWDYTLSNVLVTERVHGTPIDERHALMAKGHDTLDLCERMATLFFYMAFVDGYFHADMHPGNIFVADSGEIVLVDFGIVGNMDFKTRCFLADMLLAFLQQNYRRAAEVHVEAGYVPAGTNVSDFEDAMREVAEPIFNRPLAEISLAELLLSLFAITERFQMETRPELLLLQKTMVVIEGVARELEPTINIWELAKPLVAQWVGEHLGVKARVEHGAEALQEALISWARFPTAFPLLLAQMSAERERGVVAHQGLRLRYILALGLAAVGGGGVIYYGAAETNLALVASFGVLGLAVLVGWRRS